MSKKFLRNTSLAGYEAEMTRPPYAPKKKPLTPDSPCCLHCIRSKKRMCKPRSCDWFMEGMQSGRWSAEELLHAFTRELHSKGVLRLAKVNLNPYYNETHPERFRRLVHRFCYTAGESSGTEVAALFLLCAHPDLWKRVEASSDCFGYHLTEVEIRGCSSEEYTLYCLANDLLTGSSHLTMDDLQTKGIVSPKILGVLLYGLCLHNYGFYRV